MTLENLYQLLISIHALRVEGDKIMLLPPFY